MRISKSTSVLIVGLNSKVGKHFHDLYHKSIHITGTSRKIADQTNNCIYLDLQNSASIESINFKQYDFVIISSAMTNIFECEKFPDLAYQVNVKGTSILIDRLTLQGTPFIFISSTCVFGDKQTCLHEGQDRLPDHDYGRHKVLVEDKIKSNSFGLVLRTTKLMAPAETIINRWIKSLVKKSTITAFSDLYISPVSYHSFCAHILELMLSDVNYGIYHISPSRQISYFDLALTLSKHFSDRDHRLIIKDSCIDKDFVLYKPKESFLMCESLYSKRLSLFSEIEQILSHNAIAKEAEKIRLSNV